MMMQSGGQSSVKEWGDISPEFKAEEGGRVSTKFRKATTSVEMTRNSGGHTM